jgi:DNA polymerase III alpha subunit (gram-positive type)
MVARAPIIDEALPEFLSFAGGPEENILVAHNSPFDMGFLLSAANDCGITWPNFEVIDTVKRRLDALLSRDEAPNWQTPNTRTNFSKLTFNQLTERLMMQRQQWMFYTDFSNEQELFMSTHSEISSIDEAEVGPRQKPGSRIRSSLADQRRIHAVGVCTRVLDRAIRNDR